ncbi:hypothetical protein [Mycolicibacterium fallax]|nr:hypothetical protein [Mycolicibacterium fallax]BBY98367.1 hypothetical protein MFAL_18340 [Mycolicibacterium fallax]
MALFAPDPAAVLAERRRVLREVLLRGGMKPRAEPDRVYREALAELDRDGFAWADDRDVLRPHVDADEAAEHDVIVSARWVLVELENASDRALSMDTLRDRSTAERIPEDTLKAGVRWLRGADLCKLKDGVLRDVTGEKGRKADRAIRPELKTLRRPVPAPTPPPAPAPRTVTPSRMDPHDDPFHPSHPDYIAPSPPPRPKPPAPPAPVRATAPVGKGTDSSSDSRGSLSATATAPAPPSVGNGMEILLDVHRRVKRLEDAFASTEPDVADVSTLITAAHPDTVNCLRRLCVLLQVYGDSKRHALTDGRISTKFKVRLPEAISLGLRTGTLGLSTSDGKSLTLRDHAVAMSDAELEQRAAEQRERDSKRGKKRA